MKSNLTIAGVGILLLWSGAHWFEKLNHIYRLTPAGSLVQKVAFLAAVAGAAVVVWGCCRTKPESAQEIWKRWQELDRNPRP